MARLNLRMGLCDDVLVLHRQHGDVEANHGAGAASEIAAGRDHVLTNDVALVRAHQPLAARPTLDRGHARLAVDGCAHCPCTASQGLGQVGGLDVAVVGVADRADQAIRYRQGPDVVHGVRREEFHFHADRARNTGVLPVFVHPVRRHRQTNISDGAQANVLLRLGFQRTV